MTESLEIARLIKPLSPQRKPRILYHYTSGSGLIGILHSRCIWATNIRFLNDSTEYDFALRLAHSVIRERVRSVHSRYDEALYSVLDERLTGAGNTEVYVSCFTENADQLSQWRAYCPPAGGYAIGFASRCLARIPRVNTEGFLARCLYESNAQEKLIGELIDATVAFAENNRRAGLTQDRTFRESYKLLGRLLPLVAPALKASSFAEEHEWRLVRVGTSFEDAPPQFRMGRSVLVPYYEHSFPGQTGSVPIDELVVGPTPHPELAREAAQALLLSHGLASATVRLSAIPYRTW